MFTACMIGVRENAAQIHQHSVVRFFRGVPPGPQRLSVARRCGLARPSFVSKVFGGAHRGTCVGGTLVVDSLDYCEL